jgi:hypothetical protein
MRRKSFNTKVLRISCSAQKKTSGGILLASPRKSIGQSQVRSAHADTLWAVWQVWKIRRRGGSAVQVTRRGGFAALESSDGFLYYAKSGWKLKSGVLRLRAAKSHSCRARSGQIRSPVGR